MASPASPNPVRAGIAAAAAAAPSPRPAHRAAVAPPADDDDDTPPLVPPTAETVQTTPLPSEEEEVGAGGGSGGAGGEVDDIEVALTSVDMRYAANAMRLITALVLGLPVEDEAFNKDMAKAAGSGVAPLQV